MMHEVFARARQLRLRFLMLAAGLAIGAMPTHGQAPITLQQAVELAQRQSFSARSATGTREAARQRDRAFAARLLPQLSLSGDLPFYDRSIIPVVQPDGNTLFRPQQLNQSSLNLQVAQKIPGLGGNLFVQSALARLQRSGQLESRTWSSTPFKIGIEQDILRPRVQVWDNREQDLRIDVAERNYLEAREDLALQTSNAFFDLFAAQTQLANAVNNAAVNDTLYTLSKGRLEVGKIGENDLLQSELALLRSRNALASAKLEYDRALAALRLQLNLGPEIPLSIAITGEVPPVTADTAVAVAQALKNRAQMKDQELQRVQARRQVNAARLNTGFGAKLLASVGFNQSGSDVDLVYRDLLNAQQVKLSVQMPIVQWGARSAQIEAARADQDRVEYNRRLARELLIQEAHFAALQLDLLRDQLAISAKADTVANKRFEVAKNRYVIGRIGIDNLYIAQNEKDQAL
ncbi:MAG: TolC family protein, partial [Gemmatimonadaceae bacterium]